MTNNLARSNEDAFRNALQKLTGAMCFVLAFYEPGQTYLDTNAWKNAEAGARAAFATAESLLATSPARDAAEGWDDHNPVRSTLRKLEKDLRGCVEALGEGDDLGAVLEWYADAAKFQLSRRDSFAMYVPPKPAPDSWGRKPIFTSDTNPCVSPPAPNTVRR